MKSSLAHQAALALLILLPGLSVVAAEGAGEPINISRETEAAKLIRIAVKGYSGEASSVLRFDLEVMGCRLVDADQAQYELTGNGDEPVEGTLVNRGNGTTLLAKRYRGGTARSQAHLLADDVIEKITGAKGIAQTQIAFKVKNGSPGGEGEIYVADYDGFNPRPVTKDSVIVAAPSWVPGRFELLYTSYRLGNADIYSHDLSTGERRAVARYGGSNISPAVSPDGQHVAMILSKNGSPDLYVADLDGSDLRQLTKTREDESSPCWSPDGRQICFASRAGGRPALYVIPASGGQMRRISTVGVSSASEPDWSPDGKTIAFTTMTEPFQICVVPATGGNVTVLTAGEDTSWAPNSRTLIYVRNAGNTKVLSLLDVPTKQTKDVARVPGQNSQPAWRR
jgi:TolB protein